MGRDYLRSCQKITLFPLLLLLILHLTLIGCEKKPGTCSSNCSFGSGVQGVQLFVEPEAGETPILEAIDGAAQSVWLEMYLLTHRKVIYALEEAAYRGLDVRVILETHPYGGSTITPQQTLDRLTAAGIQTRAGGPDFALTHAKYMLIDGKTAYILTANLTLSALAGSKETRNREYGIIDSNPEDVAAIRAIFEADWNSTEATFDNPNLVVSPINARLFFETLIANASASLQIEAEVMQDPAIKQTLVDAVQRGLIVQVIMPQPRNSLEDRNIASMQFLSARGVQVKVATHLYMHAKMVIVDGEKAFVGSENFSTASLDRNRELGLLIADQQVLAVLHETFQQDWQSSQSV